jgi:hypothetical protein
LADEQEKTYEVKDKRRVSADGTLKEETQGEPVTQQAEDANPQAEETAESPAQETGGAAQEAEARTAAEAGELPVPSIYDVLQFMVGMLSEQAWQKMGVRLAPGQKELEKDMVQAKIAIDTIVFIADKLHPHIGEEERKALRGLVSDLQINFVSQSR